MLSYDEFMEASPELKAQEKLAQLKKASNNERSKAMALLSMRDRAEGNAKEADRLLAASIDIGDAADESYLALGRGYMKGDGVAKNVNEGIEYLEQAASYGNVSAVYELSKYKLSERSLTDADITRLKKAVLVNHLDSLYLLGNIYQSPEFYNTKESIKYFTLAALSGSVDAMLMLAILDAPPLEGVAWIDRAQNASLCEDSAFLLAAESHLFRDNADLAVAYLTKASNNNNPKAMRYLADIYNNPAQNNYDPKKAADLLYRAASLGDKMAKKRVQYMEKAKESSD